VLPDAVNAGTEKPITHAATDLLKSHNVGISAQAFNRMLELKGVAGKSSKEVIYYKSPVLNPIGDLFNIDSIEGYFFDGVIDK
jgi:hypothetical protein